MSLAVLALVACSGSVGLVWVARRLAIHRSMLDVPNERSSHTIPTPRLGGIGIWAPSLVLSSATLASENVARGVPPFAWAVLLGGLVVALTGLVDDCLSRGISPVAKFGGQLCAAIVTVVAARGFLAETAAGETVPWLFLALLGSLQVLWLTALANFANFMDGGDGLVAGIAVVAFSVFAALFAGEDNLLAGVAVVAAAACVGFLLFNSPPASIFMGDSGSMFIGFTLGALGLALPSALSATGASGVEEVGLHWVSAAGMGVTVTAPLWLDSVMTLGVRASSGRSLTQAHREHLYQRMLKVGVHPWIVNALYWGFALACGLAAFVIYVNTAAGFSLATLLIASGATAVLALHVCGLATRPN